MTHFAVVAPPLPGHWNPLLVLARTLSARGHRVTFVHMADAARLVEGKGADFAAVGASDHPPGALDAYLRRLAKPTGLFGLLATLRVTAAQTDMLCRDLPGVLAAIGAQAVIADQTEPAGVLVARHLRLPVVSTATALPLDREDGVPPPFVPWPYMPGEKGEVRNRGGYTVTDLLMTPVRRVLRRHGDAFGLDPFAHGGFSPRLTVSQMPRGLDFPRIALPATFHYGGPWRDAAGTPSATTPLPEGEGAPLVFCSLGTLQGARADLFGKVAEAAREAGARLLIAHGGLLSHGEASRLSQLADVRSFVPQQEVLRRCRAAVLHCGMNTVLDALAMGVPLVAMPIAFEQPATAARLAHAGVAEVVPAGKASRARLSRALKAVLETPSYRSAAAGIAAEIAAGGGVERAADLIEQGTGQGALAC